MRRPETGDGGIMVDRQTADTMPVSAKCDECPTTGTWVGCNLCRSSRDRTAGHTEGGATETREAVMS